MLFFGFFLCVTYLFRSIFKVKFSKFTKHSKYRSYSLWKSHYSLTAFIASFLVQVFLLSLLYMKMRHICIHLSLLLPFLKLRMGSCFFINHFLPLIGDWTL